MRSVVPLRRLLVCAWIALGFSFIVTADVAVPIRIDGEIIDLPRGGQVLLISATATDSRSGTIEVRVEGDYLDPDSVVRAVTPAPGKPAQVRLPIQINAAGEIAHVIVRFVGDLPDEPVAVRVFQVGGVAERARLLGDAEAERVLAARGERETMARSERLTEREVRAILARGDHPVPIAGDPVALSTEDRAWNAAVARLAPPVNRNRRSRTNACEIYDVLSPYNTVYSPFQGQMTYDDLYRNGRFSPARNAHTVDIVTRAEYTDGCGNYQIRNTWYTVGTTSAGWFTVNNFATSIPQPENPVIRFKVTFHRTGTYLSPTSMSLGSIVLTNPADFPVQFLSGSGPFLHPYFSTSATSLGHWFRWNDEAVILEQNWSYEGVYTTFRSAFDAAYGGLGCKCATSPGLIQYGPQTAWSSRWLEAHEFGHILDLQLSNAAVGGTSHNMCTRLADTYTAFHEGFADWHASWWESEGRSVYVTCNGGECQPCGTGYRVENNVMAFFWDVFDYPTAGEPADMLQKPLSAVRSFAYGRSYADFLDFYNDWTNRGIWGAEQSVADQLRIQNRVDVP